MAREYVVRDEWDVDAQIDDMFATLADPPTYPLWWRPVHRNVVSRGEVDKPLLRGLEPYVRSLPG